MSQINVNVDSEFGKLKTVLMSYACPFKINILEVLKDFKPGVIFQLLNNKWGYFNYEIIRAEQTMLIDVFNQNGVEVLLADNRNGSSVQHYSRDVAFAIDDLFVISNMATHIRSREKLAIEQYTNQMHKKVSITKGKIEGGDVLLHKNSVLVGLGESTDMDGIRNLEEILTAQNNTRKVIPIEFTQRGVIHLDTKFNIVGDGIAVFSPKSFTKSSKTWLENNFELIEATSEETNEIAINTVSISPKKVVMKVGSERIANILNKKGIETIMIKYSEVTKQPGSLRCTTCPIEREKFY